MAPGQAFGVLCLAAVVCLVSTEETCAWPDFFDVSVNDGQVTENFEINSWETNIKIKKKDLRINGKMKQNMWLTVLNNETIEVTYDTTKRNLQNRLRLHYSCVKELDDFTYLVKVMRGRLDENNTFIQRERPGYKCIQLIQRSPFVLQWRNGPESGDVMECSSGFAPIRPWPLVHLPVREMSFWEDDHDIHNQTVPGQLKNYQPCPNLGGFQIRVFNKEGNAINDDCRNDDPSPRLESECVHGDGIRIIQSQQNCTAYSTLGMGSKLNCLATWEEGRYQFSVMVPSHKSGINSFHCLRMNKEDPTKERATLFLDLICGKGELVKSKVNNFQLELRRASVSSVCDDTSDQCRIDQCDSMTHSCLTTCGACPANDTITIDKNIHGMWILQKEGLETKLNITEHEIEIFDVGTFKAYSNGPNETKLCISDAFEDEENSSVFKYLLGGVPKETGCGPRVTTLRAKKISESVLLAQIPAPAPLRANEDNAKLDTWCRNNYNDLLTFGQLFRPVYPFQAVSGVFQNTSGYLTLVNEEKQEPVLCMIQESVKDVSVSAVFRGDNETGNHECTGSSKINDDDKKWKLAFSCADDITLDLDFSCLGRYEIDSGHYAVILKKDNQESSGQITLPENYYCVIFPKNASLNSTATFHTAGECDIVHKTFVEMNVVTPIITLTVGKSSSVKPAANAIACLPVLWGIYLIISRVFTQC